MANEKIFVGELGAKEMYRRLKGIIPSAWKDWSEQHESVGADGAIYIGQNNNLNRTWSFGFGNYNTASSTILADWDGSDVVMVGSYNNAVDAAGAYQIGFRNTVRNNHRMLIDAPNYNYYTAINFGNGNTIDAEGVNIGKHNTANNFSVNIGQHNSGEHAAVAIGEHNTANKSSTAIGKNSIAKASSIAIGNGNVVSGVKVVNGEVTNEEWGSSIAVGLWNLYAGGGSMAIGLGSSNAGKYSSVTEGALGILLDFTGSSSYQSDIKTGAIVVGQNVKAALNSLSFGRNNTVNGNSLTFGSDNSAYGNSISIGYSNSVAHYNAETDEYKDGNSFAIGFYQSEIHSAGFAIGRNNKNIYGCGICFGVDNNGVNSRAVAIGDTNKTICNDAYAIGYNNNNINCNAVAIGSGNNNVYGASAVVGSYNSANQGSFTIGEGNNVDLGSSAIGLWNYGTGGTFIIGIANNATASINDSLSTTFHGNAAILGIGNTLKNVREKWHSGDMSYGETKHTFSFVSGSYINAYGHNLIAIGHGHTVGDSTAWKNDTATSTDNDGFMTAIGYKCEALRNYDFAMGYKSVAKGGQNIAVQHSTAIGYRNLAIHDSTIYGGISNIAMLESTLSTVNSGTAATSVSKNILIGSTVDKARIVNKNTIMHTVATLDSNSIEYPNSFDRNILHIGTERHPLKITGNGANDNIMVGFKSGQFLATSFTNYEGDIAITVGSRFDRNIMFANAYAGIAAQHIVDNVCISDELSIYNANTICADNIFTHSLISASGKADIIGNTVLGRTKTNIVGITGSTVKVCYNLLVNSYFSNSYSASHNYNNEYMQHNVLVGSIGCNVQHCLSFSAAYWNDVPTENPNQAGALFDCLQVYNFGDNNIYNTDNTLCEGEGNTIRRIQRSVILGGNNSVTGAKYSTQENPYLSDIRIIGEKNTVVQPSLSGQVYEGNLYLFGEENNVYIGVKNSGNTIFGSYNRISKANAATVGADYCCCNHIMGESNEINEHVARYAILGSSNQVTCTSWATSNYAISNGLIQGNNNVATDGSNIITMGNGNVSTGHNSVAIGSQLISNQWQTVIGKYNVAIAGPNRLSTQTPQDPTKALFIVGNGYSSKDDSDWQDETYITRSNALELYADGRLKVAGKVEATSVETSGNIVAANIPAAPVENGQYTLNCTVNNGTVTYNWVRVEFTTIS